MPRHRSIDEKLRKFGRRRKRVTAERGLSIVLAGLCLAVLLAVLGDRALFLPSSARLAILGLLAAGFLLSMTALVALPLLSRTSSRRLAVDVQEKFPDLGDGVLTAIELSERPAGDPASEALVRAVVENAEEAAGDVNFGRACDTRSLVRSVLALSAVCLLAAVYVAAHPLPFASCVLRLLDPYGEHDMYTYTTLDVTPRGGVVARGECFDIQVQASGAIPDSGTLFVMRGTGPWKRIPVEHCGDGRFAFSVRDVHEKIRYMARAGDTRSEIYEMNPVDRPEVVAVTVTCRYPGYTRLKPVVLENPTGGFSVLKGGTYRLSVRTSRPVAAAKLAAGESVVSLAKGEGDTWDSGELTPDAEGPIEISVEDESGIRGAEPARYRVTIREDEAPAITVESPKGDMAVLPNEVISMKVSASDDFGLISLEMPFVVLPGSRRLGRKLLKAALDEPKDLKVEYNWRIADHGAEPGDRIEFVIEASDNCEPDARSARSRAFSILVISQAEHLERLVREQENIAMRIGRLMRRQVEETDATETITMMKDKEIVGDDASRKASYGSDVQDTLSKETADVTRAISRLLGEMKKNPLVEQGSMVELASVGKGLGELSGDDMRRAAESLQQGADRKEASPRRKALREASRTQYGVSEKLRELLERVRRDTELSRLTGLRERLRELARRERALMGDAATVASRTAGLTAGDLPDNDKAVVDGLAERQSRLGNGTKDVLSSMERAITQLSFVKSDLVEKVEKARAFVVEKKIPPRMSSLGEQIAANKLFTCTSVGEGIAKDLEEAADLLKAGSSPWDELLTPSELEALIGKQKKLKEELSELMKKAGQDEKFQKQLDELKKAQEKLAAQVEKALKKARDMNRQLLGAMNDTCSNMASAMGSMSSASSAMGQGEMKQGEKEQGKALEALKKSLEAMKSFLAKGLEKYKQMCEAVGGLRELLGEQKEVARETGLFKEKHGEGPHKDAQNMALSPITKRQKETEKKAKELVKKWPRFLSGADALKESAKEMGKSSGLLGEGMTNEPAREAQKKAIALLEKMMAEGSSGAQGMGQMGMSLEMLLMLLAVPGLGGDGYDGGTIMFVPDKSMEVGERDWAKLAPRARKRVLEGWDRSYPPEFRELLEIYFERIRQN